MLTYSYVASDSQTGKKVEAEVEAANEQAAAKILAERGLSPLDIKLKKEKSGLGAFFSKVPDKQKVIFSRQLSTLVNAGLPLVQSLGTVGDQTTNKTLRATISKVISDVEAGSTFSNALANHPKVFNEIYISLIAAGEASGTLDKSLERLADQQEKDSDTVSRIRGAMIYPLIVLVVFIGVVAFLLTAVLPQVETLYKGLPGVRLPFLTRLLLSISHVLLQAWWIVLLLLVVSGILFVRWAKTAKGRWALDGLKMRIIVAAPMFKQLYMARFARVAATLVGSGVPMIKMLNTTSRAVGNEHVADSINKATEKVKGGTALSESLKGDPNFLELVPNMIRIGEQSGSLETMLLKVADYYDKEVDNKIKNISTAIEPLMMVFIGILALLIVAAVLLPIYSLAGRNLAPH